MRFIWAAPLTLVATQSRGVEPADLTAHAIIPRAKLGTYKQLSPHNGPSRVQPSQAAQAALNARNIAVGTAILLAACEMDRQKDGHGHRAAGQQIARILPHPE